MLFSSSYLLKYFVQILTLLLRLWAVGSDVADGNDSHGFLLT